MQAANVRLRPKDSVVGGLDTGVSNTPTTLGTISDLCVMNDVWTSCKDE